MAPQTCIGLQMLTVLRLVLCTCDRLKDILSGGSLAGIACRKLLLEKLKPDREEAHLEVNN